MRREAIERAAELSAPQVAEDPSPQDTTETEPQGAPEGAKLEPSTSAAKPKPKTPSRPA